ncbi:hypothetical protein HBI18_154210 [Parastagonospora nodorum]|nr:hypothetical protein HBI18_154210 [Parastagonospora nodorum]KAH6112798.1 hypothetical protein HBI64_212410 [Parastagonospora nodorum]
MSTQQSPNDAGQSPSSSKTEENIAGNPERNRTLFPRVSPAPYDHEADAAAVAQMLANRPSFQPEPDRSKDTPTALFSDRQRWDPRRTIRHNDPPMIDDFAYRLSEAAARAANKGASVRRAGWRNDLDKPAGSAFLKPFSELPVKTQESIKARRDDMTDGEGEEPPLTMVNRETSVGEDDGRIVPGRDAPMLQTTGTHESTNEHAEFHAPPYPKRAMRFPHHGDRLPARFARILPPGPFDKLHGSTEVNVPLPVHMSAQEVRELVDQKVDSLRVDMNNRFNRERELTDLRITEIKQDDSKAMGLEIKLKMSEDEKEEYKKEIRRLQVKIGQLEGKE